MIPAALSPLVSHLWQSTLFAAVAGLMTLALRRNRPSVRYWLWLAASAKFLIPFSLLIAVGNLLPWRSTQQTLPLILLTNIGTQNGSGHRLSALAWLIWVIWACGCGIVIIRWRLQWQRISVIARAGLTIPLDFPIPVLSVADSIEPGVFGILSPVLLLPKGIAASLTRPQLGCVLAHELVHVRRRDNLAAAFHMLVESVFWFYPFVWWIGKRLMEERERACDEEVALHGRLTYAETILRISELYMDSPLSCVSAMAGSDLKKRVERIMQERGCNQMEKWKRVVLIAAAFVIVALPVVAGTAVPLAQPSPGKTAAQTKQAGKNGVGYPACVYCPTPKYSDEALKAEFEGAVVVQATITAKGRATKIEVMKSPGLGLNKLAVDVVKRWKFKPAQGPDGKAVDANTLIEVNFHLPTKSK